MPAGNGAPETSFGSTVSVLGHLAAAHRKRAQAWSEDMRGQGLAATRRHAKRSSPARRLGEMNERSFGHEYAIALAIGYLPGSGREAPAWAYGLY